MLGCPCDGRLLKGPPDGLEQVQIFLAALGQEIHGPWLKGPGVVASDNDGSLGDLVVVAKTINQCDNGVKARQFSPVRVSFFDGTRDSVVPHDAVCRVRAFNDKHRGAKGVAQGPITHCYGHTSSDCSSNGPAIVL